jgi:hypothetical protein
MHGFDERADAVADVAQEGFHHMALSKSNGAVPEVIRWPAVRRAIAPLIPAFLACAVAGRPAAEQFVGQAAVESVLARVSERVQAYFARAQSLVCQEVVNIQSLDSGLSPNFAFGRHLMYEMRVAWDPAADDRPPEAKTERRLLTVNGRPPKPNDTDDCFDPRPVSPEPLELFLPQKLQEYVFTIAGTKRVDGRPAVVLDYKPRARGKPEVTWKGSCVSVDLPGWARGRAWVDASTGDVLRLDESVTGRFELDVPREHRLPFSKTSMVLERADTSIRYKPVAFHDPEEVVLLPESIETMQVFNTRTRISQRFTNYRRFMTGGRIVK